MFSAYVGVPFCIILCLLYHAYGYSNINYEEITENVMIEIGTSILSGVFNVAGISLINIAYTYEEASLVINFDYYKGRALVYASKIGFPQSFVLT